MTVARSQSGQDFPVPAQAPAYQVDRAPGVRDGRASARLSSTPTTPVQLRLYRERHVIVPIKEYDSDWPSTVCRHDGIRVYQRRGGWLHDRGEIRDFAALERGETIKW